MRSIRYYTRRPYRRIQRFALRERARDVLKMEGVVEGTRRRQSEPRWEAGGCEVVVRRRTGGTVDVYVSNVTGLAKRICRLEKDPQRNAAEVGRLLGYPDCCIRAFVGSALPHHDDFAHFKRALRATRTHPRGLANPICDSSLVAFYPCRLDCPEALRFAERILAAQPKENRKNLVRLLRRPILLWSAFDIVAFAGRALRGRLRYRAVGWNGGAPDRAARRLLREDLERGNGVHLEGSTLRIHRGQKEIGAHLLAPRSPILVAWR